MTNFEPVDQDIKKAIEDLDQKHVKAKAKEDQDQKIEPLSKYKTNDIAITINEMMAKNIDPGAGSIYLGEHIARTGEYYGMKSHPMIALGISLMALVFIIMRKIFKKKKRVDPGELPAQEGDILPEDKNLTL